MKVKLCPVLITIAWLTLASQPTRGAVSLSITPPAVSNTYGGNLTFLVAGLTNAGQTVIVQKYLDANTNGLIDAGDLLWQQFTLVDGQAGMVIGGVTNNNVPGDTDTTSGQITAKLNFQSDFLQTFAGSFLVKVFSPSNAFTPVTNSFTVTNFNYAQKFTGTVLSNSTPVANAVVILFPAGTGNGGGNPAGGTVANNAGVYSLPAPAGTYSLAAIHTNYVGEQAGYFTLTNGTTFNTNLPVLPATQSITGSITDTNTGTGLPAIFSAVQTQNKSLLALCVTDTNGNFTARVSSNQWGVSTLGAGLALHGYVGFQNKTAVSVSNANVTGVNFALPKATAFFYGTVKDASGNPLPGQVAVEAYDNVNGIYQSDGYADTNGNFVTGVLAGLGNGDPWYVSIDNSGGYSNYVFSEPVFDENSGTNLQTGQALASSIIGLVASNTISGNVKFNGTNLVGVAVSAFATINGYFFNLNGANTDANGNYSLPVGNGNWSVFVSDCHCSSTNSLNNLIPGGNYQDPANDPVTIANNNGTANFVVPTCAVQITTATPLPGGQVGSYYYEPFAASSCYGNFTWSVTDPQDIPPGLSLYSSGYLSGTPTQSGTYNFTVVATDGNNNTGASNVSLTIAAGVLPLQIITASLTNATQNAAYHYTLGAIGGVPPYSWSLPAGSANLPAGLNLGTNGVISGTPIGSGFATFIVQVTDSAASTFDQPLSLTVNASTLPQAITLSLLPSAGGTLQFAFKVASGVTYTVQTSTNLKTWTKYESFTFSNSVPTSGANWTVTIPDATTAAQQYYRVKVGQ